MNNLPYIDADRELDFNLGVILIVLNFLAVTAKGKRVLNLDKTQVFYNLVLRPTLLDRVLSLLGKKSLLLAEKEYFTIRSAELSFESMFDISGVKLLVRVLVLKGLIEITYKPSDGFLYELNDKGQDIVDSLMEENYVSITKFANHMKLIQSQNVSKIRGAIKAAITEVVV